MKLKNLILLVIGILSTKCQQIQVTYEHYRLPTSVRPEKYDLRVITHLEDPSDLRFDGVVKIKLHILEDTNNITLHAQNLTIEQSKIELRQLGTLGTENCIKNTATNERYNYLILQLCDVAKKDAEYLLTIPFAGNLLESESPRGYYKASYKDVHKNETRWLSVTQFEPTNARRGFPCFDEPVMKAKFSISLGHHSQYTALSNMPLKSRKRMTDKEDWVWSEFEETIPMSTYLVAYTINDFSYISSETNAKTNVSFRTWAHTDAIDQGKYASIIGPKVLEYYEGIFDLKFPLPKVDQIALPKLADIAMENWGLVTYRESALLYDENDSSIDTKRLVAETVAHELAHQWFGNLVTMEWWSDLWLKEGFATYISTLGVDYLQPDWRFAEIASLERLSSIFSIDAAGDSHPISQHVTETSQISSMFDAISYMKGALVIRMMHYFLGDETFRRGINHYLKKHAYNNANQNDLWNALTEASLTTQALPKNYDVKTIMDSWTLQAGYPYITVTRDYEKRTATITQTRYLSSERNATENCWWTPLTYTTKSELNFKNTAAKSWLECDAAGLRISKILTDMPPSNEWVLFNLKMSAIYRVKYDQRNWELLINALNSKDYASINVLNRVQLLDDAFSLAWSGQQSIVIALNLTRYLEGENEYLPWETALNELYTVQSILKRTTDYDLFKDFLNMLMSRIYKRIEEDIDTKSESPLMNEHKDTVKNWACLFEVADCVSRALDFFEKWRNSTDQKETNPIPNDLRDIAYCNAIRFGNDDVWNFLWKQYLLTKELEEQENILRALGCTQNTNILERLLKRSLQNESQIPANNMKFVFKSVAQSKSGFRLVLDFYFKNLQRIYEAFSINTIIFSSLLKTLADHVSTRHDYEYLKRQLEGNEKYFAQIKETVHKALENAKDKYQFNERYYEDISRFLRDNVQHKNTV